MSHSLQSHGLQPARHLCPLNTPGKNTRMGKPFPSPADPPDPGIKHIKHGSPVLQEDSLSSEPPEKPENGQRGNLP